MNMKYEILVTRLTSKYSSVYLENFFCFSYAYIRCIQKQILQIDRHTNINNFDSEFYDFIIAVLDNTKCHYLTNTLNYKSKPESLVSTHIHLIISSPRRQ